MAYSATERYQDGTNSNIGRNSIVHRTDVGVLGPQSGAPSLPMLTPLAWNDSTGKWDVWSGISEIQTITIDATGGTFTISFRGETTGALAYNASAATVQAALEGLSSIGAGNVSVSLASLVYTMTFQGDLKGKDVPAVTTAAGSLTGGAGTATVATGTAGAASGRSRIRGFLWGDSPESVATHATNDVLVTIAVEGEFVYSELALPSGQVESVFKESLRSGPRELGLIILGLDKVR